MTDLPKRWTKLAHHPIQHKLWTAKERFCVVPAGRRSGKTELAKRKIVKCAMEATKYPDSRFGCGAPVDHQAKRIYWRDLKAMVPPWMIEGKPSESGKSIRLINGAEIFVAGLDKPERWEGPPLDGVILDEYGNMKESVWTDHLRPMLAERTGFAWFIGVPEGRNHYFDLWNDALADESGTWAGFTWGMAEVLPLYLGAEVAADELNQMRMDLDELTFDQEANASFVTFTGQCYYGWSDKNVRPVGQLYDPKRDLIFCFDFNVSPGVCGVIQEHECGTCIIGEVHIPRNSNTPAVCRRLAKDWKKHKGVIKCYGDATGGAKGSAKVRGSDWDLIREELRPVFGDRLRFFVPRGNPRERVRVNAVNSRIKAADDTRRLFADRRFAPHIIKDFEGVRLLEGGGGEIDKKIDLKLTHHTDAIGYYIVRVHPARSAHVTLSEESV